MFEHFEDFEKFVEIYNKAKQSDAIIKKLREENARLLLENSELKAVNEKLKASAETRKTCNITPLSITFGSAIKMLKEEYGVTYATIGNSLGYSQTMTRQIAQGERNIDKERVDRLMTVWGIRADGQIETRGKGGYSAAKHRIKEQSKRWRCLKEATAQC